MGRAGFGGLCNPSGRHNMVYGERAFGNSIKTDLFDAAQNLDLHP